jgi:predicted HTH domain antitoxin
MWHNNTMGTETLEVSLPAELVETAQLEFRNLPQEAARLLALELFRQEKISLGRAAELCGAPVGVFMDFAASHGIPPINYSPEDLEHEVQAMERLGL